MKNTKTNPTDKKTKALKPKGKVGRPSLYSEELAIKICERIAHGELLINICKGKDLPNYDTVIRWKLSKPEFVARVARARQDQMDYYADQITQLNASMDTKNWQYKTQQIRNTQWLMARLHRYAYGDSVAHTGAEGSGPIELVVRHIGDQPAKDEEKSGSDAG